MLYGHGNVFKGIERNKNLFGNQEITAAENSYSKDHKGVVKDSQLFHNNRLDGIHKGFLHLIEYYNTEEKHHNHEPETIS